MLLCFYPSPFFSLFQILYKSLDFLIIVHGVPKNGFKYSEFLFVLLICASCSLLEWLLDFNHLIACESNGYVGGNSVFELFWHGVLSKCLVSLNILGKNVFQLLLYLVGSLCLLYLTIVQVGLLLVARPFLFLDSLVCFFAPDLNGALTWLSHSPLLYFSKPCFISQAANYKK